MTSNPLQSPRRHTGQCLVLGGLFLLLTGFLLAPSAWAQQPNDCQLDVANNHFDRSEFKRAIEIVEVKLQAQETHYSPGEKACKIEYLHLLVQLNTHLEQTGQLISYLEQLLDIKPPRYVFDPEKETLMLLAYYYKVLRAKRKAEGFENPDEIEKVDTSLHTIAFLDFNNNTLYDRELLEPLRLLMPIQVLGDFLGSSDVKVVERERLQWLLDEVQLQGSSAAVAPEIGKLFGARYVVFGSYTNYEGKNQLRVQARVVRVATGEILQIAEAHGSLKRLHELTKDISLELAKQMKVSLSKADVDEQRRNSSTSFEALRAFAEGQSLLDQVVVENEEGHYELDQKILRAALTRFQEALQHDSRYAKAKNIISVYESFLDGG